MVQKQRAMQRYGPVTWSSFELERSAEARQLELIAWLAMSDGCSCFGMSKVGRRYLGINKKLPH